MNDLHTLKSAERWIHEALQTTAIDDPLIFLVGTKRDLIVSKSNDSFIIQLTVDVYCFRLMIKHLFKLSKTREPRLRNSMLNFGQYHH